MKHSLLFTTPEIHSSHVIFGIDEAGRGCLAGPVVAACVAFDWERFSEIQEVDAGVTIRDSKLMTRVQRQKAAEAIRKVALVWGIGVVDAAIIDEVNILQATFLAMRRAVAQVIDSASVSGITTKYLIDGNKTVPHVDWQQEAIIDGDAKIFSIAAASILAKEHRDSLMEAFHAQDPRYGFAEHKGYGTKAHYGALGQYGVTPLHRKTFLKKFFAQ